MHRVRLNGSEWRIVVAVLVEPGPVSARHLARRLRVEYGSVKRIVRGLVAWNILERSGRVSAFRKILRGGGPCQASEEGRAPTMNSAT